MSGTKRTGKRKCIHCPEFDRGSEKQGYIGSCGLYGRDVVDSLCGCENRKDGTVVLWNFGEVKAMYKYGMRLRGFSLGCQPMNGFVEREDDPDGRYWDILTYNRKLTDEEIRSFQLDYVGTTGLSGKEA